MVTYVALLRKSGKSYNVDFFDFPGCISAGKSMDEALASAASAIDLHVRGMREDGEKIPPPTPLDRVLASSLARGATPALVQLPPQKGRAVRINVTIEENLLKTIDEVAAGLGISRAAFLADAVKKKLGRAA